MRTARTAADVPESDLPSDLGAAALASQASPAQPRPGLLAARYSTHERMSPDDLCTHKRGRVKVQPGSVAG